MGPGTRRMLLRWMIAVVLGVVLALVGLTGSGRAYAVDFADVGQDEWFAEAVRVLSDEGIVQGKGDGTFRPYESISRAEFVVLLGRVLGLQSGSSHPFTDFPPGSWFEAEVAALYEAGLANGVTPTVFDPYGRSLASRRPAS